MGFARKMTKKENLKKRALYMRKYNSISKNKIKKKLINKKYYNKNKDKIALWGKKYRGENKKIIAKRKKIYTIKNWDKILKYKREWDKEKCKTDIKYRIMRRLRNRIYYGMLKYKKSNTFEKLTGAPIEIVWKHLESKFKPGMTKENYGKWHIDHIIPCSSFDLSKPEQQTKCFHYSNIQPLWAEENLKKGAKLEWQN